MYDNSTPIGGQVSSARGNLIRATKSNPCPHCGKPDWCYFIGELSVCNRDQPPATGWEATSKTDKEGKTYYARPQEKKPVRPAQTRYWEYPDRDGSPLIRVQRIDFGDGVTKKDIKQQHWDKNKKGWVMGYGGVPRDNIPIYRYAEVKEAIAKGKPIFLVDGEQCADILWEFNLAATTSIGGMGKFCLANSLDLQGAKVVIVPDRDEPGIKDAEKAAEYFPEAKWLYPFPESKAWENLPKSDGLDIFDWIDQEKLAPSDIKAAIGEKKVFKAPTPTSQAAANVIRPAQFQVPPISELEEEIDNLLDSDLKKSQLQLKIFELAQKSRLNSADVWKIYRDREQELEQEANQEDTAAEVARLLASKSANLNLSELLPQELAEAIVRLANTLNLKPESYTLALFTQVSTLLKAGTSTILYPQTNFRVCPNYFGGLIAESSQKKTPIPRAIIYDPMEMLKLASEQEFEKAKIAYEEDLNQWKADKDPDRGPMPKPPAQKIYHFTTATGEGIAAQVGRLPQQALLWVADELAGAFKSANQYRGGKGSDEENLLEYWSGGGSAVLRVAGLAINVRNVGLSIFGNIQPEVLASFLGEGNDSNGKFARFDFVHQPLAATELFEDAPSVDLTPMLAALYERLDVLPPQKFNLDRAARKLFIAYYNQCERDRIEHPKQGMRAMLGKAPEKVGKLATILHCIHTAFKGVEIPENIPAEIIRAAIKFVKYTTDQALSLNLEICEPTALAPNLAKIISLAERNGGTISGAKVAKSYNAKLRPSSEKIREWLSQLASLKYGEVTSNGRNISFTLSPQSPTSPLPSKPYPEKAESVPNPSVNESPTSPFKTSNGDEWGRNGDTRVPILESLPDKALSAIGDYGDSKNHFLEKVDSLMLSCITESAEFAEQIRKAIANFDRSLAVQVSRALKGKTELRKEVRAALTVDEFDNFRLLVSGGFIKGTRVRYVGTRYHDQLQGLELVVNAIDSRSEISCLKPDGRFTTWMKPQELKSIS